MNIIQSSASMKSNSSVTSPLETECLFGETIVVLEEKLDWVYCKLITDNYFGWIKKNTLGKLKKPTHRVINVRSFIYKDANTKSDIMLYIPMGSRLSIENIKLDWAEIYFVVNNTTQIGYIPTKHIVELQHKVSDWVNIAQLLEGTPYRWGGRDTIGIDCSALLQLSYQTYGENIPRNTSEQVKLKKPKVKDINDLYRGCVVFWEGHVGIMVDRVNCIHANAFHMKTVIEPLLDIINRIDKDHKIVKMMNFN